MPLTYHFEPQPRSGALTGSALGTSVGSVGAGSSSSPAVSVINQGADYLQQIVANAKANNAHSAEEARIQREWQERQNAKAMTFNQNEAEKNRNWQEYMINTAHQREIADLKAAGLNPVLSAMNGNGASVGSGATASGVTSSGAKGETDQSVNSALVNLLGSIYNRTTQLEAANINARTQESVAKMYTEMNEIVANISANVSKYSTDRNAENPSSLWGLVNKIGKMLGSTVNALSGESVAKANLERWYSN